MSKSRRPAEPELPLFDLPLYDEDEAPPAEEPPRPPRKRAKRKKAAPAPEPEVQQAPLLFAEEENGKPSDSDDSSESELFDLDDSVLVQDRLLGGLADLTIHLATIGSMVVAVQLMGVPVVLDDWPAFFGLGLIFSLLYSIVPLAFWGHTPGMAWVGHTARSESDLPLSFGQTMMRWLGAVFTVLFLGIPLLLGLGGRSLADRLSDSKTLQSVEEEEAS